MKILQIIDSLEIGGAERMSVNIANVLSDEGINNILVCSRKVGKLKQFLNKSVIFYCLNKKYSFDLKAILQLYKIIKNESPTHIHTHSSSIYWGILMKFLFPKVKLIWHDHNGNRENKINFILKLILRFVNGIVVVNKELLNWSNLNFPKKNKVLLDNFPHLMVNQETIKSKNIILQMANLRHPKNHLMMVESIKILKQKTQIAFEVLLAGNDLNDEYSKKLKQKIKEYELQDIIKILGSVTNTSELLAKATIGVLSSESEGLPVTLLEYGLAELPVVVTDVGDCAKVVDYGKYGEVVSKKNSEKFAEALLKYLENPNFAKEMGKEFKIHVEKEYGSKKFIKEYLKFANELSEK